MKYALFSLILLSGCGKPYSEPFDLPLKGKLIYVEGLRGEGWLGSPPYGDIVMLDGETQTRHVLTWDNFYNAHPNYIASENAIIFESKRGSNAGTAGLGAASGIFRLDIETGAIRDYTEYIHTLLEDMPGGSYGKVSVFDDRKWIFVRNYYENALIYLNNESGNIHKIFEGERRKTSIGGGGIIEWSENGEQIAYINGLHLDLLVYNLKTNTYGILHSTIGVNDATRNYRYCQLGNWVNDYELYYTCDSTRAGDGLTRIFVYDSRTSESNLFVSFELDQLRFNQFNVSNELDYIVFLGGIDSKDGSGRFSREIYKYDLSTEKLHAITTSGTIKQWMRWYQ